MEMQHRLVFNLQYVVAYRIKCEKCGGEAVGQIDPSQFRTVTSVIASSCDR